MRGFRSVPALQALSVRLLGLAATELADVDRPVERRAADRCLERVLDLCEAIHALSPGVAQGNASVTGDARRTLAAARCWLKLLNERGALLPDSYRRLNSGLGVIDRRLTDLHPEVRRRAPAD